MAHIIRMKIKIKTTTYSVSSYFQTLYTACFQHWQQFWSSRTGRGPDLWDFSHRMQSFFTENPLTRTHSLWVFHDSSTANGRKSAKASNEQANEPPCNGSGNIEWVPNVWMRNPFRGIPHDSIIMSPDVTPSNIRTRQRRLVR